MSVKKKLRLVSLLCALNSVIPVSNAIEQGVDTSSMVDRILSPGNLESIDKTEKTNDETNISTETSDSDEENLSEQSDLSSLDSDTSELDANSKGVYIDKILDIPDSGKKKSQKSAVLNLLTKRNIALLSLTGGVALEKLYNYVRPWNEKLEEIKNADEIGKSSDYKLQLHFLNVGQGDCIMIRYFDIDNNEHVWMVDAGYNFQRGITDFEKYFTSLKFKDMESVDQLNDNKAHLLDGFILTHAHPDHYWNFPDVIKLLRPKTVYHSYLSKGQLGFIYSFNTLKKQSRLIDPLKDLENKGIHEKELEAVVPNDKNQSFGYIIYKDEKIKDGLEIRAFPPLFEDPNVNDNSIILYITYKGKRILLMGDAEKTEERNFMGMCKLYNLDLKNVDIVKIGHHGGFSSSSEEFVKLTNPNYAICSTGKHAALLGHLFNLHEWYPTVNRWRTGAGQRPAEKLCKILTTEEQGNIVVSIKEDSSIDCKRYNNSSLERTWWVKQALY